jgi:hypothetical protein
VSQAWSSIVYALVPNVTALESSLTTLAEACDADEVVLFEKTTFLVVSHTTRRPHSDHHRFEKVSNIVKQFKLACAAGTSQLDSLQIANCHFRAFLASLTPTTFVMLILPRPGSGESDLPWLIAWVCPLVSLQLLGSLFPTWRSVAPSSAAFSSTRLVPLRRGLLMPAMCMVQAQARVRQLWQQNLNWNNARITHGLLAGQRTVEGRRPLHPEGCADQRRERQDARFWRRRCLT